MDRKYQEMVDKTLHFIEKDRIIHRNPWFYTRLMARMEREMVPEGPLVTDPILWRLRPVIVTLVIVVALAGGTLLGKVLSGSQQQPAGITYTLAGETDAAAALFNELEGAFNEQILLLK